MKWNVVLTPILNWKAKREKDQENNSYADSIEVETIDSSPHIEEYIDEFWKFYIYKTKSRKMLYHKELDRSN